MTGPPPPGRRRATLFTCSTAHSLHDGFSDVLYLLLPLWQAEFALSLTQVGLVKSLYAGAMAACQIPAGLLSERWGERGLLAVGTAVTALGFMAAGLAGGFAALLATLIVAGFGSGTQHPLCASMVSRTYDSGGRRAAIGIYNFSGDLGKVAAPALAGLAVAVVGWRWTVGGFGVLGLAIGAAVFLMLGMLGAGAPPAGHGERPGTKRPDRDWGILDRRGFGALSAIAVVDSVTRSAFLTFLPFLLIAKGADVTTVGQALSLVFAGGAAGKFLCGFAAERVGIIRTVVITEIITSAGILLLVKLSLFPSLVLLPLIGLGLNGTSSVLYATLAEFVTLERRSRGYGLFYTVGIGSASVSPLLFGMLSDLSGVAVTLTVVGVFVLAVIPLTGPLGKSLERTSKVA